MPNYGNVKNAFGYVQKWNFKEQYVQDDENQAFSGAFLKGESTLIAVGPSNWKEAQKGAGGSAGANIAGIGLVPQMNVQQQLPVQRVLEIGSRRAHFIDGVPVGAGSLSRLLYNGPSLMRALYYMGYEHNGNVTNTAIKGLAPGNGNTNSKFLANAFNNLSSRGSSVYRQNSNNYLWLSVWDERLTLPFGLVQIFEDGAGRYAGALYLENTKIQSHVFGVAAGANMIMEQVSFMFDRAIPVNISPISS